MPTPFAEQGTTFRAQTCIEPDRIAHLARDVGESIRGRFPGAFIQFEGAARGQLRFSVRTRLARAALMSFNVDIAEHDDGFTNLDARICDERSATRSTQHLPAAASRPRGYEMYKRYARELATELARFDPLSTAILVENR
jgi:hypothetical protein